jgi:hypothetical protein
MDSAALNSSKAVDKTRDNMKSQISNDIEKAADKSNAQVEDVDIEKKVKFQQIGRVVAGLRTQKKRGNDKAMSGKEEKQRDDQALFGKLILPRRSPYGLGLMSRRILELRS